MYGIYIKLTNIYNWGVMKFAEEKMDNMRRVRIFYGMSRRAE